MASRSSISAVKALIWRRAARQTIVRQHAGNQGTQQTMDARPRISCLDMGAGVIDEVHVMHPRGAGRHAGETRETAVDVLDDLGSRGPVLLQHLLDQVNTPAWRIELVTE